MFKEYFLICLLIHILGDYYFQSERLAEQKVKSVKKLVRHLSLYLLAGVLIILPVFSGDIFRSVLVLAATHAVIDIIKQLYMKYGRIKRNIGTDRTAYIIDQGSHFICIAAVAFFMAAKDYRLQLIPIADNFFKIINADIISVLSWTVMLLAIFKPANITIKQLLSAYRPYPGIAKSILPQDKTIEAEALKVNEDEADRKAGAFIGSLERLIILMFLAINQFSAIGLVLTAKSIARYNKITTVKVFAEYYLLGTLLSTAWVIIIFHLLS